MTLPLTTDPSLPAIGGLGYVGEADASNYIATAAGVYFRNASNLWVPVSSTNPLPTQPIGSSPSDGKTVGSGDTNAILSAFNGATYDRIRNNTEGTLLASAARTAWLTTSTQTNYNNSTVLILLNVTAKAAATTINIALQTQETVAGTWLDIAESGAISVTAGTIYPIVFGTDAVDGDYVSAAVIKNVVVPRTWRIYVGPSDANSVTYSLDYHLNK